MNEFSSRYIERSSDNEQDDEYYFPYQYYLNRNYRPNNLERYIRNLIALDTSEDANNQESTQFERRVKAITKGDPREFMG